MKKEKIKTILIVLIILILCLNVGVYAAYVLSATDVNYTKSSGTTVSVKSALDELYTKVQVPTYEIGDEVTVSGEKFYVLEWDNNSDVALLMAKYNLDLVDVAQYNGTYDKVACAFSSENYWNDSFTSAPFNLNDLKGFTSTDALGKVKTYGRNIGAVDSRLLTYEEAQELRLEADLDVNKKLCIMLYGDQSSSDYCLYYWLGTAADGAALYWIDGWSWSLNTADYNYSYDFGVRPVITVLKSKIS